MATTNTAPGSSGTKPAGKSLSVRAQSVKRRQKIQLLGLAAVGLVVIATVVILTEKQNPTTPASTAVKTDLVSAGSSYDQAAAWKTDLESRLDSAEKEKAAMKQQFEEFMKNPEAFKAAQTAAANGSGPPLPAGIAAPTLSGNPGSPGQPGVTGAPGAGSPLDVLANTAVAPPKPPEDVKKTGPVLQEAESGGRSIGAKIRQAAQVDGDVADFPADGPASAAQIPAEPPKPQLRSVIFSDVDNAAATKQSESVTASTYIPEGSFARVTLMNGLDAPAGGQAQDNPVPVLLSVTGNLRLPNTNEIDLTGCTVTAFGIGNSSTERAEIKSQTLSCVGPDGNVTEVPVKGYLVGEDGKHGLRGKVVTKSGQALAAAFRSSIIAGLSGALVASTQTTTTTALGAVTTPNPGQGFQNGAAGGFAKTADKIADYYLQLAEKMFPAVEVESGRTVELVFQKGVKFSGVTSDQK